MCTHVKPSGARPLFRCPLPRRKPVSSSLQQRLWGVEIPSESGDDEKRLLIHYFGSITCLCVVGGQSTHTWLFAACAAQSRYCVTLFYCFRSSAVQCSVCCRRRRRRLQLPTVCIVHLSRYHTHKRNKWRLNWLSASTDHFCFCNHDLP